MASDGRLVEHLSFWIPARELEISQGDDTGCWKWTSLTDEVPGSEEVAELLEIYELEIFGTVALKKLLRKTSYSAYLVFTLKGQSTRLQKAIGRVRFISKGKRPEDKGECFVIIDGSNGREGERLPRDRGKGWMEIKLGEFFNDLGDDDDDGGGRFVEAALLEYAYQNQKTDLVVKGIEFRPNVDFSFLRSKFSSILREAEANPNSPSEIVLRFRYIERLINFMCENSESTCSINPSGNSSIQVDLFYNLIHALWDCRVFADEQLHKAAASKVMNFKKNMSQRLDAIEKKLEASDRRQMSFWIPARELKIHWGHDNRYWKWISPTDSPGSEEVAELLHVSWLEFSGTVELKKLLIKTTYSSYLVFKLKKESWGLNNGTARVRFTGEGKDPEDVDECSVLIDGKENLGEEGGLPQAGGKGWMEIKLGEFFNDLGDDGRSVEVTIFNDQRFAKSGLIVKGIEFRPNLGEEVVSSFLWRKFSSILCEAEADPSRPSEIVSRFRSIERLINFMCEKSGSTCRSASRDSSISVDLLYNLIHALSDCRIFTHEQSHKAAASKEVMNFTKNMSKRLDAIERKLKASYRHPLSFWIPAMELGITSGGDTRYWKWTSLADPPGSEEVAELLDVCRLEIFGTVELKKLLMKTNYSAYLVFKLKEGSYGLKKATARVRFISEGKDPEDVEEYSVLIDGKENLGEGGRLPQARGKGWMEIKLGEFFNDLGDDGRSVEAALLDVDSDRKSGLIVKGIEFRPKVISSYLWSKFSSILHEAEADPNSPSEMVSRFRSIERLVNFVCENSASTGRSASRDSSNPVDLAYDPIDALLDCRIFAHEQLHKAAASEEVMNFKKNMSKRLDAIERMLKASDRRPMSFWIPARELEITWGGDTRYWKWTSLTDPPGRSEEVAELLQVSQLEIKGTVKLKKLLIKTSYSAYLVFKLKEESHGLRNEMARVRFISEGKDPEDVDECSVLIDGKEIPGEGGRLPQARGKWWMEIKLGEFFNDLGDDGRSVEAALLEVQYENLKSGLIVRGIEFRPDFSTINMEEEVVSSYLRSKFSSILNEADQDPSSSSQIISRFRSIEERITAMCRENLVSTRRRSASRYSSIPVDVLYELIDALSEWRINGAAAASRKGFFRVYYFKKNMNKRLDQIEKKLNSMMTGPDQENTLSNLPILVIPHTYPVQDASKVLGFESEADKIETWLMAASTKEDTNRFAAIGIVGRCGCGKTALAQKVLANPTIQNEFHPKIWMCLSELLFDNQRLGPRVRVLIHILEQIDHNISVPADFSVVKLLEMLQRELMGKRYLIVLDDASRVDNWFADLGYSLPQGDPLGEFFSHGLPKGSGGAIIVTSQSKNVVERMVGNKHVIRLESNLSDDICWRIFSDLVRQQGKVNPDDHQKMSEIMKDVIQKCDGLSLGAKILADIIPNLLLKN